MRREPKKRPSDPTLWADIVALFASVPEEDWASVPRDAARRFDKYYLETLRRARHPHQYPQSFSSAQCSANDTVAQPQPPHHSL